MIFSAMPVLAVMLLTSNLTWSLYLSFRSVIPPVAASWSFLSVELTFTLRKLNELLIGRTCDDTRRVGELASLFLAGQHDCTAGDIEDGTLLLENDVTQINLVLYIHELCLELADVDAGDGVLGRELIQMARDTILADGVKHHVEVGDDVEVLGIKETALGLACVLTGQMVVILVVRLFCRRTESPFVCIDGQMADGGQIVHHDIALLLRFFHSDCQWYSAL